MRDLRRRGCTDDLLHLELIEPIRTEAGAHNVRRTIVTTRPAGSAAVGVWLDQPVEHLRDVRSVLLAKLAFLERAGRSQRPLLEAERVRVQVLLDGLRSHAADAEGFSGTLLRWRLHQASSMHAFLADELERTAHPPARRGQTGGED